MDGVMSRVDLFLQNAALAARASETTATPWRQFALCLNYQPDLWYSEEAADGVKAVRICAACPVRTDCLGWAIAHNETIGIWGGVSARGRRRIRAERRQRETSISARIPPRDNRGDPL
jgi:WhiB family transcriptional regulator, redox-sensing transcriptional regulator